MICWEQIKRKIKDIGTKLRSWKYWHNILFPNPILVLLLSMLSGGGLIWVFSTARDLTVIACFLYALSAYALTVLCAFLWKQFPCLILHFRQDPFAQRLLREEGAFGFSMYAEQCINFFYGGFKILLGILEGSAWIGADGIYNFTQGCIQLVQILGHRKVKDLRKQWNLYRISGYLIIVSHLTMAGMMFQMIQMGRHESAGEISMIATAAFTFYKLISGFIAMAKDRKHKMPLDSAAIFLNFAQALYNLFVLQAGLLWVFGGGDYPYQKLMNTLTGMSVCVLVLGMGIYMIRRAGRNLK